ncbi:MAG TPA: thioesterase domain-containing protein [Ktedonobacteraceae bacterium]
MRQNINDETTIISPWVKNLNSQSSFRLFCFPYVGGGASIFRTWQDVLPSDVAVCPVQLPGRENRLAESPFTRVSLLVRGMAHALRPFLNCPFAFFGHSMGALISFELARQLRRQKAPEPSYLFVSAQEAPQLPALSPSLHQLPEADFVEQLRRINGTPEAILQDTELMRVMLPMLRADFAMCETYMYQEEEPLTCPISVFGGQQDGEVSYDSLTAWRDQTSNVFTLRLLPGAHFFLKDSQAPLLQAISHDLMLSWT